MFETSSDQQSQSSIIVVSNTSNYHHTNGSDVINAALSEALNSVCDASYYFKNLIDFHQNHFHHLHRHHMFNFNVNMSSTSSTQKITSTDTSSDTNQINNNTPLTNTTNLHPGRKKKRKAKILKLDENDNVKSNDKIIEDNLINLKLDNLNNNIKLDENLKNTKNNINNNNTNRLNVNCCKLIKSKKKSTCPCKFLLIKKFIFKKYKKLTFTLRRKRPKILKRKFKFKKFNKINCHIKNVTDNNSTSSSSLIQNEIFVQTPTQVVNTNTETYVSYQTSYYYTNEIEMTQTQFYEEQQTLYHNHHLHQNHQPNIVQQPVQTRSAINHDLLKLSYDKFKQFRLNEKLLQQTVLIRNAIKLLQYELQYQHEQELQQQQYLYQQQQQQQQQQQILMDYQQSNYQQQLIPMNTSVYDNMDDVLNRSSLHTDQTQNVQTTSYYVNDVNTLCDSSVALTSEVVDVEIEGEEEDEDTEEIEEFEEEEEHEITKTDNNNNNTQQTVKQTNNEYLENTSYFRENIE